MLAFKRKAMRRRGPKSRPLRLSTVELDNICFERGRVSLGAMSYTASSARRFLTLFRVARLLFLLLRLFSDCHYCAKDLTFRTAAEESRDCLFSYARDQVPLQRIQVWVASYGFLAILLCCSGFEIAPLATEELKSSGYCALS